MLRRSLVGGILLACVQFGCRTPPKPPPPLVPPAQGVAASAPADLRAYLSAHPTGTWVYHRRDASAGAEAPQVRYVRSATTSRLLEGVATLPAYRTVRGRLAAGDGGEKVRELPSAGMSSSAFAVRYRLADPMPLIPAELTPDEPLTQSTRVTYMNLGGQPQGRGTLTRTATVEGYEDVDCPAGMFRNCLRVRITLDLNIHWGPDIDWTMYLWLSPQVGEVRRVQQLSGWLLIFPFGSSFEHELVSHAPPPTTSPSDQTAPLWHEGLIAFDRGIPSPSMGVLLVHFAESSGVEHLAEK